MSIFFIGIIASNARFASAPPAASASVSGNTIAQTPRPGRAGQPPAPPDPANLGELSELDVMNVFGIPRMPVIVVQGDADRLVPVATTRAWVDKMKSLGMDHQYVEVPGGDHMTPLGRMPENMKKVFDFFDAHPKK